MVTTKQTVTNLLWRFAERFGAQAASLVVSIILSRLLGPDIYGESGLVLVILNVLMTFVDSGLGNALIQKKDADEIDFSSVFYFNIAICVFLYAVLCAAAPFIASFYSMEKLTPVIRVMGSVLILSGINNVQRAFVSRNFLFKRFFFSTIGSTISSAAVGIILALNGFGIWAIVLQTVSMFLVETIILWFTVGWRPKLLFSAASLKGLLAYGWKLLAGSLLDTFYNSVCQLIIGKVSPKAELAFYNKGRQYPDTISINISSAVDSVMLSTLSKCQDDRKQVKAISRRVIRMSSFIICPVMTGIFVCAEPIIRILLTEQWIMAVPYLRIFCAVNILCAINNANINALKAVGRSDTYLKTEIIKKIIGMLLIAAAVPFGAVYMAYSLLISGCIGTVIGILPCKRLIAYGYSEQIKDFMPSALLSAVMGAAVYFIHFFQLGDILTLALQALSGVIIYACGACIFKLEGFELLVKMIGKKTE